MDITIVTTKDQLIDCYQLRMDVFVKEQHVPFFDEMDFAEKDMAVYAVTDGKRTVATCRVARHGSSAHLGRLCVARDMRKSGVGRMLISRVEDDLRAQGVKTLELGAQDTALPFYLSLGYVIDSGPFIDGTLPHHHVSKAL